jgi:hypothetical protein
MHNGPSRGDIGAGAQFSTITLGPVFEGDGTDLFSSGLRVLGGDITNPTNVGLGNVVLILCKFNFLEPRAQADGGSQDIKAIDVYTKYNFVYSAQFRYLTLTASDLFTGNENCYNMDVVPTRGLYRSSAMPGTQGYAPPLQAINRLEHRYQVHRFHNPMDPQYYGPSGQSAGNSVLTIREIAAGDNITVHCNLIAYDESQYAIFRVGESMQFGLLSGGNARTL